MLRQEAVVLEHLPSISSFFTLASAAVTPPPGQEGNLMYVAYGGFLLLVLFFLALDLGVFHREAHEVKFKEALGWSIVWITTALLFGGFVYIGYEKHWLGLGLNVPMYNPSNEVGAPKIIEGTVAGAEALKQYLTGYIIE